MSLEHVPLSSLPLERFRDVLDAQGWAALERTRETARRTLAGRVVWNVNSTARGGGVAEMLQSLVPYARGAGVDARWVVIGGNPEFFHLTKRLHNRLHGATGDGGPLGEAEHELYRATLEDSARELAELVRPGDVVLLHDPQTAGLVPALRDGARVVWRSHIGADRIDDVARGAWDFLLRYVATADGWVFSRQEYVPPQLDRARVTIVPPSIDVFAPKNQDLEPDVADAILVAAGLRAGTEGSALPVFTRVDGTPGRVDRRADLGGGDPPPAEAALVTQVSRWDRLKDPLGVLKGFAEHVAAQEHAHLVLAGPEVAAVSDDPEGLEVLDETRAARDALPPDLRERVHLACLPMTDAEENAAIVNALQRRSAVVVQKSLAEGFGLTVGEAMWKARPVVASAVGGISDQIEDGVSGVLLSDPTDLSAYGAAVRGLLEDPERAAALGAAARERVRSHYTSVRSLIQYEQLFTALTAT